MEPSWFPQVVYSKVLEPHNWKHNLQELLLFLSEVALEATYPVYFVSYVNIDVISMILILTNNQGLGHSVPYK